MLTIDDAISDATELAGKSCPKTSEGLARYISAYFRGLEEDDLGALERVVRLFAERERAHRWVHVG
jgi:hypothetical protein